MGTGLRPRGLAVPRWGWPLAAAALLAWALAVQAVVKLSAAAALWLYLAAVKLPLLFVLRCLATDGRSYLALGLAALLAILYGPLRRLRGVPARLLPAATAAGALLFVFDTVGGRARVSRFGFSTGFEPGQTYLLRAPTRPDLPPYRVRVNPLGFRGRSWRPAAEPGVRRALVVGDSFVWGALISDEGGMLDRAIEDELTSRSGRRWEVLNVAASPAALWYYVHALMSVGREVRPDLYIMSFLGNYDLEPWEVHRVKADLPPAAVALLDSLGISQRLHHVGAELGARYDRAGRADPEVVRDLRAEFLRLLAFLDETGGRLVVWEPMSPHPFLDEFRGHPRIAFAGWKDVPGLPPRLRPTPQDIIPWQKDERLAFRGDGHPTPEGNALFAKGIARRALEFLAVRRP